MLIVSLTAEDREVMKRSLRKQDGTNYYPSGLTPPTIDIVKRRFEKLFRYGPYPVYNIYLKLIKTVINKTQVFYYNRIIKLVMLKKRYLILILKKIVLKRNVSIIIILIIFYKNYNCL